MAKDRKDLPSSSTLLIKIRSYLGLGLHFILILAQESVLEKQLMMEEV